MSKYKYARWLGETVYAQPEDAEPDDTKRVLIVKGEVRKIKAETSDGYFVLHGLDENGVFGFVEPDEIQLMETPHG